MNGQADGGSCPSCPRDLDAAAEGGRQAPPANEAGPSCNTAADCRSGQVCVYSNSCEPALGNCTAPSISRCVDNPCDGGFPNFCGLCLQTLCNGFSACAASGDAGTVTCANAG